LDQIVLAGRDGISLIWYDTSDIVGVWRTENLGTGLPETPGNPFWGSGSGELHFLSVNVGANSD
jgi:hypothetical protein